MEPAPPVIIATLFANLFMTLKFDTVKFLNRLGRRQHNRAFD
jgi:hypothetical protein